MAGSSPAPRRSQQHMSPQRSVIVDIFNDDRNSEAKHRNLLETAKKEHDRVREEAQRVYQDHKRKEELQRLLEEKKKEEERIRDEEQLAANRFKLLALKDKKVEIPPPPPVEAEPPKPTAAVASKEPSSANANPPISMPSAPQPTPQVNGATTTPSISNLLGVANQPQPKQPGAQPVGFGASAAVKPQVSSWPPVASSQVRKPPTPLAPVSSLFIGSAQPNGVKPLLPTPSVQQAPAQTAVDRYTVVHRNLKALRKSLAEQARANHALKDRMGDMRREIRKCVGQLTNGAVGVNRSQQAKIAGLLREALQNRVQSQVIDPSNFVVAPRNPVQGAAHNEAQLPSLFIYLLNVFAKATISQFINEAGARPETADPVGVCIAATFSEPDFLWRGASLIDILMAKFRIVCPVLFGYRGSEKTEQGRERLGWWKEDGRWVPEQQHMDRMTGLGAGFASVALRKFGASKKENPFPARNYWTAMAKIVNTPTAEISNTQCVVLKSMVQNYEQKFIEFYGTAALAALRACLVEFPARAAEKTAAVNSLEVLAQLLKRDSGLVVG